MQLYLPDEPTDGAPVVVLMHGRGADPGDLAGLRPHLPPEAVLALPRAPFPAAAWGYGPGWAWYRFLGGRSPEPDSFTASLAVVDDLLEKLPGHLPVRPGPVVLGGFSQGGTVGLGYALSRPGRVAMVLNLSGFLPEHPDVEVSRDRVVGLRIFWGHGTEDPAIPFEWARDGWARLRAVHAELEAREYPIGHWIDPTELADAVAWIRAVAAEPE